MQDTTRLSRHEEGQSSQVNVSSVLQVNLRKLKIEDELRRIFGSKFMSSGRHDEDEGANKQIHPMTQM